MLFVTPNDRNSKYRSQLSINKHRVFNRERPRVRRPGRTRPRRKERSNDVPDVEVSPTDDEARPRDDDDDTLTDDIESAQPVSCRQRDGDNLEVQELSSESSDEGGSTTSEICPDLSRTSSLAQQEIAPDLSAGRQFRQSVETDAIAGHQIKVETNGSTSVENNGRSAIKPFDENGVVLPLIRSANPHDPKFLVGLKRKIFKKKRVTQTCREVAQKSGPFKGCPFRTLEDNRIQEILDYNISYPLSFAVVFAKRDPHKRAPYRMFITYDVIIKLEPKWIFIDFIRRLFLGSKKRSWELFETALKSQDFDVSHIIDHQCRRAVEEYEARKSRAKNSRQVSCNMRSSTV